MTIDNAANDLLQGGGGSLKFPTIGTSHTGTVVAATTRQAVDFKTKIPKTFKDGSPIMELVVTLQTDEHDGHDDDGTRRLFCNRRMLDAVRQALAGKKLEHGGKLAIQYTGDGPAEGVGLNAPKLFRAAYEAPTTLAANALLAQPTATAAVDADWEPF